VTDLLNLLRLQASRHEHRARPGVLEDVANLCRGERRVDRHRHATKREDGEVCDQPFGTALSHDRHAIAARHPERRQSQRQIANALEEFLRRKPVELPGRTSSDEIRLGKPSHDEERQIGDGVDRRLGLNSSSGRKSHGVRLYGPPQKLRTLETVAGTFPRKVPATFFGVRTFCARDQ
jgi:hypothetical protein